MNGYKVIRSSLDISKSIAFYLEMSDPVVFRPGDRAGNIKTVNDILQGCSEISMETMLAELEQKDGTYYADEIAWVWWDVQDFLHQKELLSQVCNKSSRKTYKFKPYQDCIRLYAVRRKSTFSAWR